MTMIKRRAFVLVVLSSLSFMVCLCRLFVDDFFDRQGERGKGSEEKVTPEEDKHAMHQAANN